MSRITNSIDIREKYLDDEALKKLVVDLKLQSLKLKEDQHALSEETAKYDASTSELKQKYNIIGAAAEISGWANDESNAVSGQPSLTADDKKWIEANRKLETQILNQDIKSCLPKLESEALRYESNIFAIEKAALQAIEKQKELPNLLNKTSTELEDEMGVTIESRIKLKAEMARDADARRREKTSLINKVSKLREQLTLITDENEVVENATFHINLMLSAEETRIKTLMNEMDRIRSMFSQYHGPNGWAKEAFRAFCRSNTMTTTDLDESLDLISDEHSISVSDVPASLVKWCAVRVTTQMVAKQMVNLPQPVKQLNLQQYIYLCQLLIDNEGI